MLKKVLSRRKFLRASAGVAVAGPSTVAKAVKQSASAQTLLDLQTPAMGNAGGYVGRVSPQESSGSATNPKSYAMGKLKELIGESERSLELHRRNWWIDSLDPNAANLRSVNIQTKVAMSRNAAFWRNRRMEKSRLQGIIDGWLD